MTGPQMCTVDDILGGEPCPRVATRVWQPDMHDHPVFLCNFHAEPFTADAKPLGTELPG